MSHRLPLYARVLRLRHLRPGGLLCFLFFEGSVALGILLALAEVTPWWSTLVLPVAVAAMVKVNDVVAGWSARARPVPAHARPGITRRTAGSSGSPPVPRARRAPRSAAPGTTTDEGRANGRANGAGETPANGRASAPHADQVDASGGARVSGRATAPGALPPSALPGFGSGAGSLGIGPSSAGTVYRHTPDEPGYHEHASDEPGYHQQAPDEPTFYWHQQDAPGSRRDSGDDASGEQRRGLNQGRFDQPA